jgi:hypothetical protein
MSEAIFGGVSDHLDPFTSCLHPTCRGLTACAQKNHGPIAPAYFDLLGIGGEHRDIFSHALPDADMLQTENPIIHPGNREHYKRPHDGNDLNMFPYPRLYASRCCF